MNRRGFLVGILLAGLATKSSLINGVIFFKEKFRRVVTIDISHESTEGGEIRCYLENGSLLKMEKFQFGECGRYMEEWLFSNGGLYSVKEISEHYNVPFYVTKEKASEIGSTEFFDPKKSKIEINLYFFSGDKIKLHRSAPSIELSDKELIEVMARIKSEYLAVKDKIAQYA